jgi:hypothetical protein
MPCFLPPCCSLLAIDLRHALQQQPAVNNTGQNHRITDMNIPRSLEWKWHAVRCWEHIKARYALLPGLLGFSKLPHVEVHVAHTHAARPPLPLLDRHLTRRQPASGHEASHSVLYIDMAYKRGRGNFSHACLCLSVGPRKG